MKRGVNPATFAIMGQLLARQYFASSFPLHIMELQQEAVSEHSHDFFEMVYVRRGRGWHIIEGERYPIQAGDLYAISPGETHGYAPHEGEALQIVNLLWMPSLVDGALRGSSREKKSRLNADASTHNAQTLEGARRLLYVEPLLRRETRFAHRLHLSGRAAHRVELLIDEMKREQTLAEPGSEILLRHLFCALLVLLSRAYDQQIAKSKKEKSPTPQDKIVARAIEYLEENYAQDVRVADVAAHVALSSSRLSHVFKESTRRGVNEYLHELRVAKACAALLNSELPIGAIAADVGYCDARFFHRMFRRYTGCNPTQYRLHYALQK